MKVLIAEDDMVSATLLESHLARLGYECVLSPDGETAWKRWETEGVRLVITDWTMPGVNGLELCRRIREAERSTYTYVIVITANDRKQDFLQALEAGADDFMVKPFDPDEVRARMRTAERIARLETEYLDLQGVLIESRNKLRIVFDALSESIVSIDRDLRIVSANEAFLEGREERFADVTGEPLFTDALCPAGITAREPLRRLVQEVLESGEEKAFLDEPTAREGGGRVLDIQLKPIKDRNGRVFKVVLVFEDITEARRRNDEIQSLNRRLKKAVIQVREKNTELEQTLERLRDTQAQVLQTEKMASVGQLAAGVAHEINNPTGFVSSNLETLAGYQEDLQRLVERYRRLKRLVEGADAGEVKVRLDEIEALESEIDIDFIARDAGALVRESLEGMERIRRIVGDLKDFAHPGNTEEQVADINQCLESTLNVVWNELKYKSSVVKDYGEIPPVACYPQQLNQVFMNILVNAAQAFEQKGEIRISTRRDNGALEIVISDTGPGIPEEHLGRVFDPFFTTKEQGKGTGLGLNIAYNIVRKHNGAISVRSEPGRGTAFTIRLPAGAGEVEQA